MTDRQRDLYAYFGAEMAYLYELGAEFAEAHPESAHLLAGSGADPSVERLLQGAAFLTARIRHRLDDELPEVASPIIRLLWPGYLRPVPASTIQVFEPRRNETSTVRIPAGTRVRSREVKLDDNTPAIAAEFVTSTDVEIPPLTVTDVRVTGGGRHGTLYVTFSLGKGRTLADLERDPFSSLRIYIDDPELGFAATTLYHLVHDHGAGNLPQLTAGERTVPLPRATQVGLGPEHALVKGWSDDADGFRLLQEYFAFPQKFLFFELQGLDVLPTLGEHRSFSIAFPFARPFPDARRLRPEHFVLGATPAANWFERAAHPISRQPLRPEYRVLPSGRVHEAYEIIDVTSVRGLRQGERGKTTYQPLQEALAGHDLDEIAWYDVRLRRDPGRRTTSTYLVLSPLDRADGDERISANVLCCNGALPSALKAGDVSKAASGLPAGVKTANLGRPSGTLPPPLGSVLPWRLVGHVAAAQAPLRDVPSLRSLLGLFNFRLNRGDARDIDVHHRRMEALRSLEARPADMLVPVRRLQGGGRAPAAAMAACRGTAVRLSVETGKLEGEGMAWLLGTVLDRFLARWSSLNSFTRLEIDDLDRTHEEIRWPARLGERPVL